MSGRRLATLAARLDLAPDELERALSLGAMLAGLTSSYTLAKTARDAHFLSQIRVSRLPLVFIGVGILSALVSVLFARFTRRKATWESLAGLSLVASISLAAFWQLFRLQASWVPVAFYLWTNVYGLILISQFWLFANSVSNPREARSTFSLIGLGGIFGGLVGGLVAAPLAHVWSPAILLVVAAVIQALVVLLVRVSSSRTVVEPEPEAASEPAGNPLAHPYVRWLALASLCSVMVTGILDYQFKAHMQRHFFRSPEDYVSFLGMFYTFTNLAAFGLQALGTRWMIQRLGASWASLFLPAGLGITTTLTLLFPGLATVMAGRSWDQVARLSVGQSVGELFYFPLDPGVRRRAKAFIGAGLERLGDGFSGAVILLTGVTVGIRTRNLALVVAGLLLVWLIAWLRIRRGYVGELGQNLRRMSLGHEQSRVSLREAGILREVEKLLESPYERVVLQGMDLLDENAPERLEERLDRLLRHPSGQVRARALTYIRVHRLERFAPEVSERIQDMDPEVQVQALGAQWALSGVDVFEPLREHLQSTSPRVRNAAILALTEQAPTADEGRLREMLEEFLASGDPALRAAVAEGLGRRLAPSGVHEMLTPLLADAHLDVRRAALKSAGRVGRRAHIPVLIDAVGVRATEDAARVALVTLGERVVGTLGDYLADSTVPMPVRQALPRALAEILTQDSVNALFRCRDLSDVRLSYRILKASNRLRASGARVTFPRRLVGEDIERDVGLFLFARVHGRIAAQRRDTLAERLLSTALEERVEQALNRVFRRMALIYAPQNIAAAYRGVTGTEPRPRGNAIEYLENALAVEHRSLVLPLVDERAEAERVRLAESRFGLRAGGVEQTLEHILQSDDEWLRACALYVAGSRRERSLLPLVESNLSTLNAVVRETASWARIAIATSP